MAQKSEKIARIPKLDSLNNPQKIDGNGRIEVSSVAKFTRGFILVCVAGFLAYGMYVAGRTHNPLVIFASIMPITTLVLLVVAWCFYRNPQLKNGNLNAEPLVSIIIPVYN